MPDCVKEDVRFRDDAAIHTLIEQFEQCNWPYERWTHRCHLAVAVIYLRHFPFAEALQRARVSIQRYNRSLNNPGYHETITTFFMRIVDHFLKGQHAQRTMAELVDELHDTIAGKESPGRYYTNELLNSAQAKARWVEPDLQPLPD